ncbi:NUDIX hydrolase [candidate division KSB3 bacterium]|uniref:NUDIX hydrolase n=1 Tax=candidate division KSB3 bacterium TaxID=2044937 RepID=A0A2G6E8U7_9BACT|nr:MAG: NUDIX hydrolase [candidate division KSB3 bacterium]PIE30668.1 MAG: NUDIX hydrolase [candidate division KSB3 bacterium]
MQKDAYWYQQSGVIPYRIAAHATRHDNSIEIVLITSRKRKRWIIPKGIIEPGMTAYESAEKEALEEAGILGEVSSKAISKYRHQKWGGTCEIVVFPLKVNMLLEKWDEMHLRQRKWMSIDTARRSVRNATLKQLIADLPQLL